MNRPTPVDYSREVKQVPANRTIQVVNYDPKWPNLFQRIRERVWPSICDFTIAIEHVGSTSVPGLAAKPVLDIDVVIPSRNEIQLVVTHLSNLGYAHRGDLGIEDREAFTAPEDGPAHHLYVCSSESVALLNHLTLRDHLRAHPSDVEAYSALKKRLAEQCSGDLDRYVEGKTDFILSILAQYGFSAERLEFIRRANRG
jgi:GrpB-like predicted nucleotidyltransferase (UPF0157 family)